MKFKIANMGSEFSSDQVDPRLRAVLLELDRWLKAKFNFEMTITELGRTETEEMKLNPTVNGKAHVARPCRGADIRTKDMPQEVLAAVKIFFLKWWPMPYAQILFNDRGVKFPHIHVGINPLKEEVVT